MSIGERMGRWVSRFSEFYTLWQAVAGISAATLTGYLSTFVDWFAQFGAFGWVSVSLITLLIVAGIFACFARARLWRAEAKRADRTEGQSSDFDPMASVYTNKRLYIRDLAPLGRREVRGKKFIGCEIIGPGMILIGMKSHKDAPEGYLANTTTNYVDLIQVDSEMKSELAVRFVDCNFDGCGFYNLALLFYERKNHDLNWITPVIPAALIEDHSDGE